MLAFFLTSDDLLVKPNTHRRGPAVFCIQMKNEEVFIKRTWKAVERILEKDDGDYEEFSRASKYIRFVEIRNGDMADNNI